MKNWDWGLPNPQSPKQSNNITKNIKIINSNNKI